MRHFLYSRRKSVCYARLSYLQGSDRVIWQYAACSGDNRGAADFESDKGGMPMGESPKKASSHS